MKLILQKQKGIPQKKLKNNLQIMIIKIKKRLINFKIRV
jgi:hypothetical protein